MTSAIWSDKNIACIATYNILEGDQLLNQFDRFFLSFDKAGTKKLCELPYYPKHSAAKGDIEGRSAQMARQYFKFLISLYTNRKERAADSIEEMLDALAEKFADKTATIGDLAAKADGFLKFKGE